VIVTLWHRAQPGLRMPLLNSALARLRARPGGPIDAFSAIVRARAFRPFTIALAMRTEAP
jgi:hypothetical protein